MNLVQIVAPLSEPLSLEDAKTFMHILENDEDTLIESFISGAREYAENYTNRQLMTATFELTNEIIYSGFALPKNPVQSVTKIEYMDLDGGYQLLDDSHYYVYVENEITKLHINQLPIYKQDKRAFKITFIGGYYVVPSGIVAYIRMAVSTMYENRESYVIGVSIDKNANPLLDKMLNMFRIQPI
ncbi:head-tail connector protein [Cetobacterium sp.]|uniref:head-tail connector protein n=1 Tax=Cetobacterium sp. TaxID=2071632 RepID=UPI003F3236CB